MQQITALECGKCNARETDYGFEYYIPSLKKQCRLRLCVFCKHRITKDEKCKDCGEPYNIHGMKTKFSSDYETNLMAEKKKLAEQLEIRKEVQLKWDNVRVDPIDYDQFLELIEECVQAKESKNQLKLGELGRKIQDLKEKYQADLKRQIEIEKYQERPAPKPLSHRLKSKGHQVPRSVQGYDEVEYHRRKLQRYF